MTRDGKGDLKSVQVKDDGQLKLSESVGEVTGESESGSWGRKSSPYQRPNRLSSGYSKFGIGKNREAITIVNNENERCDIVHLRHGTFSGKGLGPPVSGNQESSK